MLINTLVALVFKPATIQLASSCQGITLLTGTNYFASIGGQFSVETSL